MSGIAELGRVPIPGDSPSGVAATGTADFDALREETTKDPVTGEIVDWKRVVELGTGILTSASKDFTTASYLGVGLAMTGGFEGLRDGLHIMIGLIEAHWESGFPPIPKRMRGRVNAVDFLVEKSAAMVQKRLEPTEADREPIQACSQACEELWKLAGEKFEGHELAMGDLSRALREVAQRLPPPPAEPSAEPPPAPETTAVPQQTPAQAATPRPAPSGSGGAKAYDVEIKAASDVGVLVRKCTKYLRDADPRDPLGYRLPRAVRWAPMIGSPIDTDGRVDVPGPAAQLVSGMRAIAERGDWQTLLEEAEDAAWQFPLWLDASRYAVEALLGLGGPYRPAADGIVEELRSLLGRAATLSRLAFSDGTEMADAETQRWIKEEVQTAAGGAVAAVPGIASEVDEEVLEAARTQARALAKKRELPAALAVLREAASGNGSPRASFLARLEIATLCAESGRDRLALPLLQELDEEVLRFGLEAWEPALSVRVLETSYLCSTRLAKAEGSDEIRLRGEEIYRRLCRVDPVAAAALD